MKFNIAVVPPVLFLNLNEKADWLIARLSYVLLTTVLCISKHMLIVFYLFIKSCSLFIFRFYYKAFYQ